MWRFVLLYGVLFWGGLMIITSSLYRMIIGTLVYNDLRITVPVYLVSGLVFGLVMWLVGEYMYRKSSSNESSSDRQ